MYLLTYSKLLFSIKEIGSKIFGLLNIANKSIFILQLQLESWSWSYLAIYIHKITQLKRIKTKQVRD